MSRRGPSSSPPPTTLRSKTCSCRSWQAGWTASLPLPGLTLHAEPPSAPWPSRINRSWWVGGWLRMCGQFSCRET